MTDNRNAEMLLKIGKANGYDLDATPGQHALALAYCDAALKLARETTCAHCDVIAEPIPAGGLRWVVQEHHEPPHCSKHDDSTPGVHRAGELYPPDDGQL